MNEPPVSLVILLVPPRPLLWKLESHLHFDNPFHCHIYAFSYYLELGYVWSLKLSHPYAGLVKGMTSLQIYIQGNGECTYPIKTVPSGWRSREQWKVRVDSWAVLCFTGQGTNWKLSGGGTIWLGLLRYMAGLLLWSYMKELDEREQWDSGRVHGRRNQHKNWIEVTVIERKGLI